MLKFINVKNPHIYLVGAGGTGGFLLEKLTRLFANFNHPVTIEVIDGDTVEGKNLKRQNFTFDDLDHKKAQVLCDRLAKLVPHAPKLVSKTDYLTDNSLLTDIALLDEDETPIIVDCVDNTATRRLINDLVKALGGEIPVIVLNSGNNEQGGQIVAWSNKPVTNKTLTSEKEISLKSMLELFPETNIIKDDYDENPGLVSICAEESESKPQTMMANVFNSDILASLIFTLATNKTIAHNVYRVNLNELSVKGFDMF